MLEDYYIGSEFSYRVLQVKACSSSSSIHLESVHSMLSLIVIVDFYFCVAFLFILCVNFLHCRIKNSLGPIIVWNAIFQSAKGCHRLNKRFLKLRLIDSVRLGYISSKVERLLII